QKLAGSLEPLLRAPLQALVPSGNNSHLVPGVGHRPRHRRGVRSNPGAEEGRQFAADKAVAHERGRVPRPCRSRTVVGGPYHRPPPLFLFPFAFFIHFLCHTPSSHPKASASMSRTPATSPIAWTPATAGPSTSAPSTPPPT